MFGGILELTAAMMFAVGFLFLFTFGGFTGMGRICALIDYKDLANKGLITTDGFEKNLRAAKLVTIYSMIRLTNSIHHKDRYK